ncbi:hypothetical protein MIDIC_140006 [Alphaproteobacteria bacterium]
MQIVITNWNNDGEKLTNRDIIVIDEAGMLGSRDLGHIIDEAALAESKVVLIGDPEQLQAIQAGAAFRGIVERIGHVELSEVRCQKELWQKEATKSLAIGATHDALVEYQKHDMVHELQTQRYAIQTMVRD